MTSSLSTLSWFSSYLSPFDALLTQIRIRFSFLWSLTLSEPLRQALFLLVSALSTFLQAFIPLLRVLNSVYALVKRPLDAARSFMRTLAIKPVSEIKAMVFRAWLMLIGRRHAGKPAEEYVVGVRERSGSHLARAGYSVGANLSATATSSSSRTMHKGSDGGDGGDGTGTRSHSARIADTHASPPSPPPPPPLLLPSSSSLRTAAGRGARVCGGDDGGSSDSSSEGSGDHHAGCGHGGGGLRLETRGQARWDTDANAGAGAVGARYTAGLRQGLRRRHVSSNDTTRVSETAAPKTHSLQQGDLQRNGEVSARGVKRMLRLAQSNEHQHQHQHQHHRHQEAAKEGEEGRDDGIEFEVDQVWWENGRQAHSAPAVPSQHGGQDGKRYFVFSEHSEQRHGDCGERGSERGGAGDDNAAGGAARKQGSEDVEVEVEGEAELDRVEQVEQVEQEGVVGNAGEDTPKDVEEDVEDVEDAGSVARTEGAST